MTTNNNSTSGGVGIVRAPERLTRGTATTQPDTARATTTARQAHQDEMTVPLRAPVEDERGMPGCQISAEAPAPETDGRRGGCAAATGGSLVGCVARGTAAGTPTGGDTPAGQRREALARLRAARDRYDVATSLAFAEGAWSREELDRSWNRRKQIARVRHKRFASGESAHQSSAAIDAVATSFDAESARIIAQVEALRRARTTGRERTPTVTTGAGAAGAGHEANAAPGNTDASPSESTNTAITGFSERAARDPIAPATVGEGAATPATGEQPAIAEPGAEHMARTLATLNVDRLSTSQRQNVKRRYSFVMLVEQGGKTVKEAIELSRVGLKERGARRLLAEYRAHGPDALLDGRRFADVAGRNPRRVMTDAVISVVRERWTDQLVSGLPDVAPLSTVHTKVKQSCESLGLPVPSYASVYELLTREEEAMKLFREGKEAEWRRKYRGVNRHHLARLGATRGNARGLYDHQGWKNWVRVPDAKSELGWSPARAHVTAGVDAATRVCRAMLVDTEYPDSWQIALTIRKAILEKADPRDPTRGIDDVVQTDKGRDFLSDDLAVVFAKMHTRHDPDPPRTPDRKGPVERFFRTLNLGCQRGLPGHKLSVGSTVEAARKHVMDLLTIEEYRYELHEWRVALYHHTPHDELDDETPLSRWLDTAVIRMPESTDVLNAMLLKSTEVRVVHNEGIHFTYRGEYNLYNCGDLEPYRGQQATLAYNPEDRESILVYPMNAPDRVIEVPRDPDPHEIVEARTEYRKGVTERLNEYANKRDRQEESTRQRRLRENVRANVDRQRVATPPSSRPPDGQPHEEQDSPAAESPTAPEGRSPSTAQPSDRTAPRTQRVGGHASKGRTQNARPSAAPHERHQAADAPPQQSAPVLDLVERLRRINRGQH